MLIILKGGPGSGWYGPPKGTHTGGADNAKSLLTRASGWDAIDPKTKRMLLNDMRLIPSAHMVGITGVVFEDIEGGALYRPLFDMGARAGVHIVINPNTYVPGHLPHEVGHHVFERILPRSQRNVVAMDRTRAQAGIVPSHLLRYDDETFAEVYKLHLQGAEFNGFDATRNIIDALEQ